MKLNSIVNGIWLTDLVAMGQLIFHIVPRRAEQHFPSVNEII